LRVRDRPERGKRSQRKDGEEEAGSDRAPGNEVINPKPKTQKKYPEP